MRLRLFLALLVCAITGAGCNAILGNDEHDLAVDGSVSNSEFPVDARAGHPSEDSTVPDAAATDAHPDGRETGALGAGDGQAGDGGCGSPASLLTDVHNCGACGNDCTLLANVSADAGASCSAGHCTYTCATGYGDCVDAGAGCPIHLGTTANCGGCGTTCGAAAPVCAPADGGVYACTSGCAGGQANCSGTCADLTSDPTNCGACGTVCAPGHAAAGCTASSCSVAACTAGFADCNTKAADGCEVNTTNDPKNCGGCGNTCNATHTTPACTASTCAVGVCATGFADCDKLASTGCEVNTTNDTNNCGACGTACTLAHATSVCTGSSCAVAACATGFADCDGLAANGCETDITQPANCGGCNTAASPTACGGTTPVCSTGGCVSGCPTTAPTLCGGTQCVNTSSDPNNCGACASPCGLKNASTACTAGNCAVATCTTGFADCNAKAADGCEVNTTNDVKNCGGCGLPCAFANATTTCSSSTCAIAACSTGFADCNNKPADGCEVNTTSDVKNCSACGAGCAFANAAATCTASACAMSTCNAGFADCNTNSTDGCEVNITNDVKNCGACNIACSFPNATATCSGSSCVLSACSTGFLDCNAKSSDGCEINTTNDKSNCGGCGKTCAAPASNGTAVCSGSSCSFSCTSGFTMCGGGCWNTGSDSTHCGTACSACAGGTTCQSGSCQCAAPTTMCSNACVNEQTDPNNCGRCGHSCQGGTCSTGLCQPIVVGPAASVNFAIGVAVDSTSVYWVEETDQFMDNLSGSVRKAPLAGGGTFTTLAAQQAGPTAIAVSAGNIFWANGGSSGATGGLMHLAPGAVTATAIAPTLLEPVALAVNSTTVFWFNAEGSDVSAPSAETLLSLPLSNLTATPTMVLNNAKCALAIALNTSKMFWIQSGCFAVDGTINSATLSPLGTSTDLFPAGVFISGPYAAGGTESGGVGINANNVYFGATSATGSAEMLASVPLAGGGPTTLSAVASPNGVAADATNVYWTDNLTNSVEYMPIGGGAITVLAPAQMGAYAIVVDSTSVYWTNNASPGAVMKVTKP